MGNRAIFHQTAPLPRRPYSPGLIAGPFVMLSGQLGIDPATDQVAGADIRSQTTRALENIRGLLQEAGLEMSDVVKTTIFLRDIEDYAEMNEVYRTFFSEPRPARSTIGVVLSRPEYRLEIEAWAFRG